MSPRRPHAEPIALPRRAARTALAGLAIAAACAFAQEPAPAPPVHDPANGDYGRLQQPAEAFTGLPRDKRGRVDWMKSLRDGLIKPRADVKGEGTMQVFKLDVVMKNTAEMPYVTFPHESHTMWLECANCHDGIFVAKAGANRITMEKIFRGQFCGVCHDRVAFTTMFACERCHNVLHGGGEAWWEEEASPSKAPQKAPSRQR
jgi:c(7)-type cytochrome triheme protein